MWNTEKVGWSEAVYDASMPFIEPGSINTFLRRWSNEK